MKNIYIMQLLEIWKTIFKNWNKHPGMAHFTSFAYLNGSNALSVKAHAHANIHYKNLVIKNVNAS